MKKLEGTELAVSPLCLGGNSFGWTVDERGSAAVLDRFVESGGNFLDTADAYSSWAPGNVGGESESIIGRWQAGKGNRDSLVIATKVGHYSERPGLGAANIHVAVEDSLRRLQVDHIDLYYAHFDFPDTPLEETLGAFDELVRSGKVRYIGASNYSAARLSEALAVSEREHLARFAVLQPHYNLARRAEFEEGLQGLCLSSGISCVPYQALASGFLTGKYRRGESSVAPGRAERAGAYLNPAGDRILAALDEVAKAHEASLAAVALAWLAAQPSVVAPIAGARTTAQLDQLLAMSALELTGAEISSLDEASQPDASPAGAQKAG